MLYIKNNNLYYKNYRVFNGEISPILILILIIILYYNRDIVKYFSYISISIFVIGLIDSYLRYKKYHMIDLLIFGVIFHSIFLYPLIKYCYYLQPNYLQLGILIISICFIYFYPIWPYLISKNYIILILVITHLILFYVFLT